MGGGYERVWRALEKMKFSLLNQVLAESTGDPIEFRKGCEVQDYLACEEDYHAKMLVQQAHESDAYNGSFRPGVLKRMIEAIQEADEGFVQEVRNVRLSGYVDSENTYDRLKMAYDLWRLRREKRRLTLQTVLRIILSLDERYGLHNEKRLGYVCAMVDAISVCGMGFADDWETCISQINAELEKEGLAPIPQADYADETCILVREQEMLTLFTQPERTEAEEIRMYALCALNEAALAAGKVGTTARLAKYAAVGETGGTDYHRMARDYAVNRREYTHLIDRMLLGEMDPQSEARMHEIECAIDAMKTQGEEFDKAVQDWYRDFPY